MINAILLISFNGEVLIARTFKGEAARVDGLLFSRHVVFSKELSDKPIRMIGSSYFIHIIYNNIIFVASTRENANYTLIVRILYKFADILSNYFNGKLNVHVIKRNFVLIYELLDEILDCGYPQILEIDVLKRYITQGLNGNEDLNDKATLDKITVQATGSCSWRAEGIKYKKNEVYIDVIEQVNVLISQASQILRSDVSGQIIVKSMLSGMPECKFGMNDKLQISQGKTNMEKSRDQTVITNNTENFIVLDDCKFHQCVRLSAFDMDQTITFIPPDGSFQLMSYRTSANISIPFKIFPTIREKGSTKLEVLLSVKSSFPRSHFALNVIITIPFPENTGSVDVSPLLTGKAKYDATKRNLVWRIRKFTGEYETFLNAEATLVRSSSVKRWSKPPISMNFRVPMFTSSGLCVRYLRIQEKQNYRPIKWIRYLTTAGSYQHRI